MTIFRDLIRYNAGGTHKQLGSINTAEIVRIDGNEIHLRDGTITYGELSNVNPFISTPVQVPAEPGLKFYGLGYHDEDNTSLDTAPVVAWSLTPGVNEWAEPIALVGPDADGVASYRRWAVEWPDGYVRDNSGNNYASIEQWRKTASADMRDWSAFKASYASRGFTTNANTYAASAKHAAEQAPSAERKPDVSGAASTPAKTKPTSTQKQFPFY